jgi:hypothetical protein
MGEQDIKSCTAFEGSRRIASGNLVAVAKEVKEAIDIAIVHPEMADGSPG